MKTRIAVTAVAVLSVAALAACGPPPPPTFIKLSSYPRGVYPVSTEPTEQFRIEPGLYMTEPDGSQDAVNREDASGTIFVVPVMDRVLIEVKPTDLSVQVVAGSLVPWAARVPTVNTQLDGLYLNGTEVAPRKYKLNLAGPDGIREWDRLKAINVESDADILDGDFSNDGSQITPLVIDATTPPSVVPAVYMHGGFTV
jgi:hypothetical protein